jgi:HemY protein
VWNPHPDLADVYANLKPGDSARERLARIQALAAKAPAGNVEAALAVARAALDAQEFAIAREALAPLIAAPTRRVAALMAELEERQHGDTGRAREWMTRALHARRDPAWTADGFVSDHWMPVSPVSGRLDAFEWKDPLAGEDAPPHAMIEADKGRVMLDAPRPEPVAPAAPVAAEKPPADVTRMPDEPMARRDDRGPDDGGVPRAREPVKRPGPLPEASPVPDKAKIETKIDSKSEARAETKSDKKIDVLPPLEEPSKPELPQAASAPEDLRPRRVRGQTPVPIPPALIPLVHAPDDPGPDPDPDAHVEPEPEPTVEPLPDSWSRIRQLFRQ